MGALVIGRKRSNDSYTPSFRSPGFNSPPFESSPSKKARFLPSLSQELGSSIRQEPEVSVVSRLRRYPDLKPQFKREPIAPVRSLRVWNLRSGGGSKFGCRDNSFELNSEMGTPFRLQQNLSKAKETAFASLRHVNVEEAFKVDKVDDKEIYRDSSTEDVEILEDVKDWNENLKGSTGVVEDLVKSEVNFVDGDSRPSSSSIVTNVSNENLKVESWDTRMAVISLSEEPNNMDKDAYKKLLRDVERRTPKLNFIKHRIEYLNKSLETLQLLRPREREEVKAEAVAETSRKELVEEAFRPLTNEEENEVTRAFSIAYRRKLLVQHKGSNIDITGDVLQCLTPGKWLNDEVINLYLGLLKEREKREPQKFLRCHFFNTFFYKKLISGKGGYSFQSVRRWTSQKKLGYFIFDCDKIFVPIHKQVHWCLAVINKKEEKFQYLDSLGDEDPHALEVLARYLVDEMKEKSGKEIDVSSWKQEFVKDLPEQQNGFDCGVFMIKYADFYSRGIGLCFEQEHMPYFRRRTAKEILRLRAE